MKPFIAAIAGILTAVLLTRLGEMAGHFLFPIDAAQLDLGNISMRDLMLHLPVKVLLMVALAHTIGLLAGLFVSRLVDKTTILPLYFITGILFLLSLINILVLPHPVWFIVLDLGLLVLFGVLFIRMFSRGKG